MEPRPTQSVYAEARRGETGGRTMSAAPSRGFFRTMRAGVSQGLVWAALASGLVVRLGAEISLAAPVRDHAGVQRDKPRGVGGEARAAEKGSSTSSSWASF